MPNRGRGGPPEEKVERINQIWMVIHADNKGEGVVSAPSQRGVVMTPLIAVEEKRRDIIRSIGKMQVRQTGKKMKLIKLTVREDVEDL